MVQANPNPSPNQQPPPFPQQLSRHHNGMEVTCPICFDVYNDKMRIPRILTCGHTFCQHCLMDLRTSNILTCPTCRSYFSPDVKQLIKNFTILDYLYSERHVTAQREELK